MGVFLCAKREAAPPGAAVLETMMIELWRGLVAPMRVRVTRPTGIVRMPLGRFAPLLALQLLARLVGSMAAITFPVVTDLL